MVFGLFKKKNKAPEIADAPAQPMAGAGVAAVALSADAKGCIERWDAGLAGIQSDFDAILADFQARSVDLAPTLGTDLTPLSNLWNAANAKLHQHTDRIADLWDEVSDELSEFESLSHERMDKEGQKRDHAHVELELSYRLAEKSTMAAAVEAIRVRASSDPSAAPAFEACAFILGEIAGHDHWAAATRAENQIDQYHDNKDVPVELLARYRSETEAYWTTALGVEAQHVPKHAPHIEQKVAGYLREVDRKLGQYWQWRERNQPVG